jgi:hypothetical protein
MKTPTALLSSVRQVNCGECGFYLYLQNWDQYGAFPETAVVRCGNTGCALYDKPFRVRIPGEVVTLEVIEIIQE